ncbi:MAG: hypothetical protein HYV97_15050 [Bdellovibrio sp.]|nr:hypothetical protein [Bdellovibrio sp.]
MMALILRIILFFCLYQLFRAFLRKPKRIQTYRARSAAMEKPVSDDNIVEAEYRVIKK